MSGYSYASTDVTRDSGIKALPRTGREEIFGFAGNTVFFSREPQADLDGEGTAYLVKFVSPVGAEITVPPHWHPTNNEYFRVFEGSLLVTLDGVKRAITPADGEVIIPKRAVHSLHVKPDMHTEFAERADIDPVQKMYFLKTLLTQGGQASPLNAIQVMRVFYEDGDVYPSTGFKILDVVLVYVLGCFIGSFLGFGKISRTENDKTK